MTSTLSALSDLVRAANALFMARKFVFFVESDSRFEYYFFLYSTAFAVVGLTFVFAVLLVPVWAAEDIDEFLEAILQ